jgi:hypothetical protein
MAIAAPAAFCNLLDYDVIVAIFAHAALDLFDSKRRQ